MNPIGASPGPQDAGRPFGVEIQHLLAFLAIYEERQVTLAARRLGRTQSALSHSLAKFRELMRDELFVARAGEMWPTAEAQQLYPRVKQAVDLIDSLHVKKRAFDPSADSVDLRVGMTDYTQKLFSPRIWAALERSAPGVRLTVIPIDRYGVEGLLMDGVIDLAIVGDPLLTQPAVLCDELFTDAFVVACASANGGGELDMAAYLAAGHLQVATRESGFGLVDSALRAAGHRRNVRCVVPNYLQVPAMLENSRLLATLVRGVFVESGDRLLLRAPPFEMAPVRIGLLYLHAAKSSSVQRWGADLVRGVATHYVSRA